MKAEIGKKYGGAKKKIRKEKHLTIFWSEKENRVVSDYWQYELVIVSLIGEKVDIHAAIKNRIWSEIVSRVEEKRDE